MAKSFSISTIFNGVNNLGRTTRQIMGNLRGVERVAKSVDRNIKKISGSFDNFARRSRTASAAAAIAIASILAPSVAFSDQINELEAVSRAGTQQMAAMTDQAKKLGSTTRFSASEAASAQTFLARAGFKVNEILAATPDVLNLAAASNMELARTADIASNIMGAFKIPATEMAKVSDVLAATTSAANVDLEQLAESLKFAAPIANKAGLSLQETAAAVGLLGNVGIQGTLAGTALRRMLASLAAPAGKAKKLLSAMGVSTTDTGGRLRKLPNILSDISKAIVKLPSGSKIAAINEIFGLQGISPGAELIDQAGIGRLDELAEKLTNVEGRAQEMADTMNKGPGGAIRRLKSAAEGLSIALGEGGLTDQLTDIANRFANFASQLSTADGALLTNIGIILVLVAVMSPILSSIGFFIGLLAPLATGLIWVAGIIGATLIPILKRLILNMVLMSLVNPVGLVILGITLLIAAIAALAFWWDDIVAAFKTGVSAIIGFFQPLIDIISSLMEVGSLFGETVFGSKVTVNKGGGDEQEQSLPARFAANQATASANASANVSFQNAQQSGAVITDANGEEIDPDLGVSALAGFAP